MTKSRLLLLFAVGSLLCVVLVLAKPRGEHSREIEGYVEREAVTVTTTTGGRIVEVLANRGDQVRAGQLLLRFDSAGLEQQAAQISTTLDQLPASKVDAALSTIARLPPSTWASTAAEDPARLSAEREYVDALAEANNSTGPAARARLRAAIAHRDSVYRNSVQPDPAQFLALRRLNEQNRKLLTWLEVQRKRFEARVPADGTLELFEASPGTLVSPLSPVALVALSGRFRVRGAFPEDAVGRNVKVSLSDGREVAGVVTRTLAGELQVPITDLSEIPSAGQTVRICF